MIMTATRRRHRTIVIIGLALMALLITGCVSVPTAGKVEQVDRDSRVDDSEPEAVPKPPVKDATPRVIVDRMFKHDPAWIKVNHAWIMPPWRWLILRRRSR